MAEQECRPNPEVVAHGGASTMCSSNSLQAMERALVLAVDRIECDVQLSRDGDLVLVHDDRIQGPDGQRRPVRRLATAELRACLPGLLLLDELAEMTKGRTPLMIDVKGPGYEAELVQTIRHHRLDARSSVATTHALTLRRLHAAFPGMPMGLSTGHFAGSIPSRVGRRAARSLLRTGLPLVIPLALRLAAATETMIHYRGASPRLIEVVHAAGKRVNLWTVDDETDIRWAICLGADGIISNRPDVVQRLIRERESGPRADDRS